MSTKALALAFAATLLATGAQAAETTVKTVPAQEAQQVLIPANKLEKPAKNRFFYVPAGERTNTLLPLGGEYYGPTSPITIGGVM